MNEEAELRAARATEPAPRIIDLARRPMRALILVALVGCKHEVKPTACANLDLVIASTMLDDHPCRDRVDAAYGRMLATGMPFSGTLLSTRPPRGAGVFVTCQHCAGAAGDGLHDPERAEPAVTQVRAPVQRAGTKLLSGRASQIYFIHRVFSPRPPQAAFDAKGHLSLIEPRHDFVIGVVSGTPVEVVGHLGALPSATVSDAKLAVHDPANALAADPGQAEPGTQALVLGFPRDTPTHAFGGELVASIGEILDDARAKDLLARADADEAAIAYDPAVEFVVAARSSSGMSGGGVFDARHRYLGVAVRGTVKPVDGVYLTRIVRAAYVTGQLDAALARAPASVRDRLAPFVR